MSSQADDESPQKVARGVVLVIAHELVRAGQVVQVLKIRQLVDDIPLIQPPVSQWPGGVSSGPRGSLLSRSASCLQ